MFETGGRVVLTDHGAFILINVYVPNAGPSPERPRAAYKYKFLEALKIKAVSLQDAGRQVIASTSSAMTAWLSTEHAAACVVFKTEAYSGKGMMLDRIIFACSNTDTCLNGLHV